LVVTEELLFASSPLEDEEEPLEDSLLAEGVLELVVVSVPVEELVDSPPPAEALAAAFSLSCAARRVAAACLAAARFAAVLVAAEEPLVPVDPEPLGSSVVALACFLERAGSWPEASCT
jgi:hypothetical protein